MKKILLATVAIIGFAGAASAADLAVRPAPIYAPVFNWSGCYIGGYVGGAWASENATAYDRGDATGLPYYLPLNHGWSYDLDSSFIGGGTAGCNWQPVGSPFVFGIEGEIGYVDISGSAYDPTAFGGFDVLSTTKIGDWYGMITGRLGYAWDRVLVYVKGGAAFLDVENSIVDNSATALFPGLVNTSVKDSIATWTVGGGLEYAFNWNWSLKAEYMYIGIGDTYSTCGLNTGAGSLGFGRVFCWDHDVEGIHTAKIGLNYRFGGGAPLVARY